MLELSIANLLEIHAIAIERWGGREGLRPDTVKGLEGALGAALFAADHAGGELGYAAGILCYIARAQHFLDGNKRVAWGGAMRALEINGYVIRAETADILEFMERVVLAPLSVNEIADQLGQWVEVLL